MKTMAVIIDSKGILDEQSIVHVENALECTLPNDYREFLKNNNGGYPEPDGFNFIGSKDGSSVDRFLDVSENKNTSILYFYKIYKNRIPSGFIPVAKDPGGNLLLIDTSKELRGVYFWDHETESEDGENPNMDNMHLISTTFNDFIKNLYVIDI